MRAQFAERLQRSRAIAILRGLTPERVPEVCRAMLDNDFPLVEIPLNSPDALRGIARAVELDDRLLVGAGTVLTPEQVRAAAQAGARYIISPNVDRAVIEATREAGLISIPGFFTPTEAFAAAAAGADYLKLFPAARLGAAYFRDLKAVLTLPLLAVGGVEPENVRSFLEVGAGVALGSALFRPEFTVPEIREKARQFRSLIG